jgi:sugar phosphate isomerase/epimerase
MNRALYVSTNCFPDRSPDGILTAIRQGGWTHVEFSGINTSPSAAISLCRRLRSEGVEVLLHNYFPPSDEPFVLNLASTDPELQRRSRVHCQEAIILSAELGAPFFAAHAGFAADLPPSVLGDHQRLRRFCQEGHGLQPVKEANAVFAESVKSLAEFGRRYGVRFLIENHVAEEALGPDAARLLLLCLEAEDFIELAKATGVEDFGVLLDVGHLRCTSGVLGFSKEEFCQALSSWIYAFHLSDNDGRRDAHRPFDADSWFLDVIGSLPEAAATLEFNGCSNAELARSMQVIGTP